MSCEVKDNSKWNKKKYQENHNLGMDDSQGMNNSMIPQSHLERLKSKRMTKKQKEKALTMYFFIKNIIPRGHHIVIFGAAGSGKTTIALYFCFQIVKTHQSVEILYLYLDGQLNMSAQYENYLEEEDVVDRFSLLTNITAEDALSNIETIYEKKEIEPQNIIVVLDTLKYLNPNINNKDANVKAMQRIKQLTNKGITFISLHHTNKDGENYSGTADIEQDSDAMLKIVTGKGDEKHTRISTIQEGGRVRYPIEARSYKFTQGDPSSVEELEDVFDPDRIEQQDKDRYAISVIKGILSRAGEIPKTELEKLIKEDDGFEYSEKDRKRILRDYKDIHWRVRKGGERNNIHYYSVIDNTSDHIDAINRRV